MSSSFFLLPRFPPFILPTFAAGKGRTIALADNNNDNSGINGRRHKKNIS